jgi:hypothetical protein
MREPHLHFFPGKLQAMAISKSVIFGELQPLPGEKRTLHLKKRLIMGQNEKNVYYTCVQARKSR